MSFFSKINFNKENYFNLLIAFFPLSFIAGNMIININLILLIFSALIIYKLEVFKIRKFLLDKFLILYFLLIILTAIINDYYFFSQKLSWKGYFSTILKSLSFLRYLLFYFILRYLLEKKIISLKLFFIFSSLSVLFVCFDIFLQFFVGKDIFGYTAQGRKLSGPFGDELIAGGFIQRFSIFSFFVLPIFFKNFFSNKFYKYIVPILFVTFFTSLILSGNRMPSILFLLSIFMIILFQKQTRKFLLPFIIIFSLIFVSLFNANSKIKNNFLSFYGQVSKMVSLTLEKDFFNEKGPQYLKEFSSFYDTWLINKYLGGGIKNFRYYCHERPNIKKDSKFVCNMHPHNYYLEILTETGILGMLIILVIFSNIIYLTFFKKYFLKSNLNNNNLIIPFIFLFIVEIMPIKSTGSFFTTGNSTYIFLIIAIMIGLIRKDKVIENKN